MQSRVKGYKALFKDKPNPKERVSPIELDLWLERNLRERARNAKRGSEERIRIFVEMLEKIAVSDPVFGSFVERVLIDVTAEKEEAPTEVQALSNLLSLEKKLENLKKETTEVEEENSSLKKQLSEIRYHIDRRQKEISQLEATMRERADIFQKQRQLNNQLNDLFKVFDEPLVVKKEVVETDAPQIIALRSHNESLEEQLQQLKRSIEIAEEEVETIKSIK